jgi:hypothetical protein
MMEWISVKDRLPEFNKNVLVVRDAGFGIKNPKHKAYPDRFWVEVSYVNKGNTFFTCELIDTGITTHWMPLPQPPKE